MNRLCAACMLSWLSLLALPAAQAEVFKCVLPSGAIVYSEKKEANAQCTVVTAPINVVPANKPAAPRSKSDAPEGEVKQDPLKDKIAEQERALAEAKKALTEQEGMRIGGEQNYQKKLDRLKPYQDKVAEIEAALAKLREEQSKAK